ncbi:MAG: SdrD B-like domain-containing protein [Acidimicrobiales bacterium]
MLTSVVAVASATLVAVISPVSAQADVDAPSQPTSPVWRDRQTGVVAESATAEREELRATWTGSTDAGSGVAQYRVQVSRRVDFAEVVADRLTGSTNAYAIVGYGDGIRYGSAYYFRVAAVDGAGNQSGFSPPSNRVEVTDEATGPAVVHAPVPTGFVGQPVTVKASATCGGAEQTCSTRLYWRATPITGPDALVDGITGSGWQSSDLARGAETQVEGRRAFDWTGSVPGTAVSTSGVDYWLEATDTLARTQAPGGAFVGSGNATGVQPAAHGYYHVHVVSPPIPAHVPPPFGRAGEDLVLRLDATCSTGDCRATLYYRTTTGPVTSEPLVATPNWPRVAMTRSGTPQSLGDAGDVVGFTASVPASAVDTRGVDYFIEVTDDVTRAWWPGTTYQGYYAPTDGMRTGYHHVHVLEPPHVVHAPVVASPYRQPVAVSAQANCQSTTCSARLYYRTTTSDVLDLAAAFDSAPMAVTPSGSAGGVQTVAVSGQVPASYADTRGVDYFLSVTDGATTTWWPGTSSTDGYVPVAGTRVGYHHTRVTDPPHFAHVPVATAPALADLVIETELTCVKPDCAVTLAHATTPLASSFTEVAMAPVGTPTATPLGLVGKWRGVVPAAKVTTAGLAYWMWATDGHTTAYQPGTSYWGAYVPVDGLRTGAHVVRVLEPPHVVHAPVATAYHARPVPIEARSNCAGTCTATLHWRTSGHGWQALPMSNADGGPATPAGATRLYRAEVPASGATTEGVDYRVEVTDGYVTETTPTYHVTVLAPTAVLHAPVVAAFPGVALAIEAAVPCSTALCRVELSWRIPGEGPLAEPPWTVVPMDATGVGVVLGEAGAVGLHRATIPADKVTTRGLEYFIRADDGHTTAYSPGTAYVATQATRLDGQRVRYFSVHVVEPVRIVHAPVLAAQAGDPVTVAATVNCSTRRCAGTLAYRATPSLGSVAAITSYAMGGPAFTEVSMASRVTADAGPGGTVLELTSTIAPGAVTTAGVDYFLRVTDGDTTAYFPGTSYLSGAGSLDGVRAAWVHVAVSAQRVTATVGDLVWSDRNRDGSQSPVEPGIAGVRVRLAHPGPDGTVGTADDQVVATRTTDGAGAYSFTGLAPGTYQVAVEAATLPPFVEAVSGTSPRTVTVAAGEQRTDVDFGYRFLERATLAVDVWVDYDADGARDPDDEPLPGVAVGATWAGDDDVFGNGDDRAYGPTSTGPDGRLSFGSLPEGTFRVTVDAATLPAGLERVSGASPAEVRVAPGATVAVGVGYRWTGHIDVVVWDDTDGDDAIDGGERRVPGARVVVSAPGPDGVLGTADDKVLRTGTSDAEGKALFPYLAPGPRRVTIADRLVVAWEVAP